MNDLGCCLVLVSLDPNDGIRCHLLVYQWSDGVGVGGAGCRCQEWIPTTTPRPTPTSSHPSYPLPAQATNTMDPSQAHSSFCCSPTQKCSKRENMMLVALHDPDTGSLCCIRMISRESPWSWSSASPSVPLRLFEGLNPTQQTSEERARKKIEGQGQKDEIDQR